MFGRARQLRHLKEGVAKLNVEGLDAEGQEIGNVVLTQLSRACEMLSKGVGAPDLATDLHKRIARTTNGAFSNLGLMNAMNAFNMYMARVTKRRDNEAVRKFVRDAQKLVNIVNQMI